MSAPNAQPAQILEQPDSPWQDDSQLQLKPSAFNALRPIHVAGTKGKGSTSAFISSILAQYQKPAVDGQPTVGKIGLYTSPHLRSVRERIQINNAPISEEVFARYFFSTWDRLEESARKKGEPPTDVSSKPVYFRFLTLMAFHTYLEEGIDTAIIEAGIGGEYDSTNVILRPSITAITSLGIDHVAMLGNTIEEIAWHKAGIMKPFIPLYTVPQPDGAMAVLEKRAKEKDVEITVVERHPALQHIKLGLAADFQKTNASLAIAVAAAHLRKLGFKEIPEDINTTSTLPEEFRRGLENVQWGGRCETRKEGNLTWFIDGGHTLESIKIAGEWYASELRGMYPPSLHPSNIKRVLVFNQQTRDAVELAKALHETLTKAVNNHDGTEAQGGVGRRRLFSHVIFCSNITFKEKGYKPDLVSLNASGQDVQDLTVQKTLAKAWPEIEGGGGEENSEGTTTTVEVLPTIEHAVEYIRDLARKGEHGGKSEVEEKEGEEVVVLVTGSLHLVGGLLEVLESKNEGK
ncbi:MAG: hypothetical protein M1823_000129 [Watsoniomyces obsoletus]|nr:MAG: hypothetical protein M1823_000129 [Watsoniomyces obsoletus]